VLRHLLKYRLELGRPVTYVDATNLTVNDRRAFIKLAELYDADVEAVFFDVAVEECQRRNQLRHRVVPDEVIQRMAERMVAPSVAEGFSRVTAVT
jgi:predicted kinase